MKLFLFAGYFGSGKTTSVNLLKSHFEKQGLRVCTFQRSKNFNDLCRYSGDHFILPSAAFTSISELENWLPVGYDVGIMEFITYLENSLFTYKYKNCISENMVNEVINPENTAPERETNIVYSKTDDPIEGYCCFNTDFSISGIEHLVYFDVNPAWVIPSYPDIKAVFVGTIPPEWYSIFPNHTRRGKDLFIKDCEKYDLSIIGAAENLKGIFEHLPADLKTVCLYPPAFNSSCIPYQPYSEIKTAIQNSEYPDYWYNPFKDASSISITENQVLFNGIPPIKFILDQGWLSGVI